MLNGEKESRTSETARERLEKKEALKSLKRSLAEGRVLDIQESSRERRETGALSHETSKDATAT